MKTKMQNFYIFVALIAINFISSCSSAPEEEPSAPRSRPAKTGTGKDATGTPDDKLPITPTATPCWDRVTKAPAVLACEGIYSFSSKSCAGAPLKKEATCTRDSVAQSLASKSLNGKPAIDSVDAWIAGGYEINQCAKGDKAELYVYLIKKTFVPSTATPSTGTPSTGTPATGTPATGTPATGTPATGTPATATSEGQGTYTLADKKLGDAGGALDSIKLSTSGVIDPFTCQ